VRRGDNLSRIASRLGVTVSDLRRDNGLRGDLIHPGQRLKIARPFRRLQSRDLVWRNPLGGRRRVLREFGPYLNTQGAQMTRTGVDVATPTGTPVLCPAHGVIRYFGGQEGFGTLVILEHGAGYSTVLAPLDPDRSGWKVGDVLWRGDRVGVTGSPVEGSEAYLHVELRRNDKAVRPTRLLE